MVICTSGLDRYGKPCEFYLDDNLKKTCDVTKERVLKRGWDYVACFSGPSGVGKSTATLTFCKYLDPNFNVDHIAFTAEGFISLCNSLPDHSAIVLDESFADLNTRSAGSKAFMRLYNILQLVRFKGHYLILVLPNFFDLQKNFAIFRTSHLILIYAGPDGKRGRFIIFGKNEKKNLYIKGSKFLNYQAVKGKYRGKYVKGSHIIDLDEYNKRKRQHLLDQDKILAEKSTQDDFTNLCGMLLDKKAFSVNELSKMTKKSTRSIYNYQKNYRKLREKTEK